MSEAFQTPPETLDYVPQSSRPKSVSPWLLGCGVLAMSLLLLGGLAAVVGVLLMFAVRTRDRAAQVSRTGPSVAQFRVAPPEIQSPAPNVAMTSPRTSAQRLADAQRAVTSARRTLAAAPHDADALNNLAWALATAPEELRDAEQAVALAERAVQLQPENRNYINTLGAAYYRSEQYDRALAILDGNAGERTDALVLFDLYFVAMAQVQTGQADKAHETYRRALDHHRRSQADLSVIRWQELYEFRLEAASLLLGEPPAQVFERAGELARRGEWEPAAAEFAKALDVYPIEHWQWYRSGALRAHVGDAEAYRDHCRQMLDLFGDTPDPFIAERAGKLCLLLPDAVPDNQRAVQLCDRSVDLRPDGPWFHLASAIARYRTERYQEALLGLQAAQALAGDQLFCQVLIDLFRAMGQHQLGERQAAQGSLEEARSRLNTAATTDQDGAVDYGPSWHDHLMCEVILREAESLLGGAARDPEPEAAPSGAPEPAGDASAAEQSACCPQRPDECGGDGFPQPTSPELLALATGLPFARISTPGCSASCAACKVETGGCSHAPSQEGRWNVCRPAPIPGTVRCGLFSSRSSPQDRLAFSCVSPAG